MYNPKRFAVSAKSSIFIIFVAIKLKIPNGANLIYLKKYTILVGIIINQNKK